MRASTIKVTPKGVQLGGNGEAVQMDSTAMLLMQQRQNKKRRYVLKHSFGMPIRKGETK